MRDFDDDFGQHSNNRRYLVSGISFILICFLADAEKAGMTSMVGSLFVAYGFFRYGTTIIIGSPGRAIFFATVAWLFTGFVFSLSNEIYDIFKDVWYFVSPFVYFVFGFVLFKNGIELNKVLRLSIVAGSLSSSIFLFEAALNPAILNTTAVEIRQELGVGYFSSALAIISVIGLYKLEKISLWRLFPFAFINIIAIYLYYSRGIWLVLIFGIISMSGLLNRNPLLKILGVTLFAFIIILSLRYFINIDDPDTRLTLLGKVAGILDEGVFETYLTFEELNLNWRGYEAAQAFEQFKSASILEQLLGQGFGTLVDVGIYIALGDSENIMRYLPILHNGYLFIMTKCGIVGLLILLYIYYIFFINSIARFGDSDVVLVAKNILMTVSFCFIVSTWSIAGIFNKTNLICISVVGAFCLAFLYVNSNSRKYALSPAGE